MKLSYPRSMHFLKRNVSRSIATKAIYSNITSYESFLKALGGCKVKFPLPQDPCSLRPSVEVSKDARKAIAKGISSSLSHADLLVAKKKESKGNVLIVYSILKEILRYGYGDLMDHFKAPTELQEQLIILHEEETEGKELEAFIPERDMRGKLQIEFQKELEGSLFTGNTDFLISDMIIMTPQKGWKESLDKPNEETGKIRFLAMVKDDLSNEMERSEAHYQLIAQLITALELNARGHQCWGALTDGYKFHFYRVSRGADRVHDFIVEKGMQVSLFEPDMLHGEHPVEALNYFFSSMYPEINRTIDKDHILQSDVMSSKVIHFKKNDFEHSFKEFTQKELTEQILHMKKKLASFPDEVY